MQRWVVLAALTLARVAMGVQFQSIAALSPQISAELGLGFVAIGTLMGAYLLPGAVAALFGGWAGQKFGDIRIALAGLGLMALGGAAGAFLPAFESQVGARLVAGIGAVGLNVMLSKMAGDWFQGRSDLPFAMGILVSSWPAGLALAMLMLPLLSDMLTLTIVLFLPAILCICACGMLALVWRSPFRAGTAAVQTGQGARMTRRELMLISVAGLTWALYNVSFIGAISWSTGKLQAAGADAVSAAAAASLISWAAIISVAGGGWLARSLPRPDGAALGCFALSSVWLVVFVTGGAFVGSPAFLLLFGLLIGPAAAMVMTLPVEATRLETRALGMGIYWAIYYALMGTAPAVFGMLRDRTGSAGSPLILAAGLLMVSFALWLVFRRLQAPMQTG